jgi:antitoxin ParD1/3/4
MSRTITFQANKELGCFIEDLLKTGTFNNQSEVIRAGLRLLQEQTAASKLQKLRNLIDEAENSPVMENWDINEFLARTMNKNNSDA